MQIAPSNHRGGDPPIPLDEAVTGALGGLAVLAPFACLLEPERYPRKYPVPPFAITNLVWAYVDGAGATGLAAGSAVGRSAAEDDGASGNRA